MKKRRGKLYRPRRLQRDRKSLHDRNVTSIEISRLCGHMHDYLIHIILTIYFGNTEMSQIRCCLILILFFFVFAAAYNRQGERCGVKGLATNKANVKSFFYSPPAISSSASIIMQNYR